jgi:uncharacterized membrane protein YkoI
MKVSKKILAATTVVGTICLAGFSSITYATSNQPMKATTLQQKIAAASDGDAEAKDDTQEQPDSAKLQALAKITPQQAQQFAEASAGTPASSVKLENEDGNLVYAVAIGSQEVIVDAGNGRVLYTDNAHSEEVRGNRPASSIKIADREDGETNDDK